MLSKIITVEQRFILVVDEVGQDRIAQKAMEYILKNVGADDEHILRFELPLGKRDANLFDTFYKKHLLDTQLESGRWNVLLPTLGELLNYEKPGVVFRFLDRLLKCDKVEHLMLWASVPCILDANVPFILASCEYMADMVMLMETTEQLTITLRKASKSSTRRHYTCTRTENTFEIEPVLSTAPSIVGKADSAAADGGTDGTGSGGGGGGGGGGVGGTVGGAGASVGSPDKSKSELSATFKIDLEEDEVVARNALKLPYERTAEPTKGAVVYTPDANDDFDDSEPEEEEDN